MKILDGEKRLAALKANRLCYSKDNLIDQLFELCDSYIPTDTPMDRSKPAPCGCHPEAGIVCDTCAAMAEKNVEELAEYVNDFITKRFPSGLEGDIRRIISECVMDAFHDGARWAEAQPPGEPSLILDPNAPAAPNRTIIFSR